jgi:hypothetical protein
MISRVISNRLLRGRWTVIGYKMARRITIIAFSIMLALVSAADAKNGVRSSPEYYTPSSAIFFLKTSEIEKIIESLRFTLKIFDFQDDTDRINSWLREFSSSADMDPLDSQSISRAGIDTRRSIAFALLRPDVEYQNLAVFLPIKSEKGFPLKFIDILKKNNTDRPDVDLNPLITKYRNYTTYQVLKDIFFCSLNGYFVITSSVELLRKIIDIRSDKTLNSLADESSYKKYRKAFRDSYDINFYIKEDFFSEFDPDAEREKTISGCIDYIGGGLKRRDNQLLMNSTVSIKKDHPAFGAMHDIFAGDINRGAVFFSNPVLYLYTSANFGSIGQACGKDDLRNSLYCGGYNSLKNWIKNATGMNFEGEIIPDLKGYINIIASKAVIRGMLDNFVVYVPLKESAGKKASLERIISFLKKKNNGNIKFTDEVIDDIRTFWMIDRRENKIYFTEHNDGLYSSNNIDTLKMAINEKKIKIIDLAAKLEFNKIDNNTFMFLNTKLDDESFIKAVLTLVTFSKSRILYNILNKSDNVSITGKRLDNDLLFEANLRLIREK